MPDLDKILKMSELFGVSTDYLLKDNAAEEEGCAAPLLPEEGPAPRPISLEEANFYLELSERCHKFIALAVALFILSPVPLIAITGMAEYGRIALSEDVAAAVGLLLLFVIVAAGVAFCCPAASGWSGMNFWKRSPSPRNTGWRVLWKPNGKPLPPSTTRVWWWASCCAS